MAKNQYVHAEILKGMTLEEAIEEGGKLVQRQDELNPFNKKANERQVGGEHYKNRVIQPWDVIDSSFNHAEAIGFYKGNAIKYIMRAGSKGPAREDYEKAVHYLEKLLEVL